MAYIGKTPTKAPLTSSDIANDIINSDHIGDTAISGFSALTSALADTDEFLVSDAGTLKRIDASLVGGGIDGWSSSSNNLLPDSASSGIYLGVNSATASNLLDDYEEGTFTPTWTSNVTVSVASGNYGYYTKIGDEVTLHFGAVLNSSGGTPNYFSITNAPFQANVVSGNAVGSAREYGQTGHQHLAIIADNSTTIQTKKYDSTAVANPYLAATITYRTD